MDGVESSRWYDDSEVENIPYLFIFTLVPFLTFVHFCRSFLLLYGSFLYRCYLTLLRCVYFERKGKVIRIFVVLSIYSTRGQAGGGVGMERGWDAGTCLSAWVGIHKYDMSYLKLWLAATDGLVSWLV